MHSNDIFIYNAREHVWSTIKEILVMCLRRWCTRSSSAPANNGERPPDFVAFHLRWILHGTDDSVTVEGDQVGGYRESVFIMHTY